MNGFTYPIIMKRNVTAIVFDCSDTRCPRAFRQFLRKELGLEIGRDYQQTMVMGGAAALAHGPLSKAHQKESVTDFYFMVNQAKRLVKNNRGPDGKTTIKRFIFLGHQDCHYYLEVTEHPDPKEERVAADLRRAAEEISRILNMPEIRVEAYFGRFTDASMTKLTFDDLMTRSTPKSGLRHRLTIPLSRLRRMFP